MAYIESESCVRMNLIQESDLNIKVKDWVKVVTPVDAWGACSSDIGRDGGEQILYLGTWCVDPMVVLHELLHTVGFYHEQNRPDRDQYIYIREDLVGSNCKLNMTSITGILR